LKYNPYMFCDDVTITCIAGNGGNGRVSFYPGFRSGPDGGDGGRGGSIYVKADDNLDTLERYASGKVIRTEDGGSGQRFRKNGKGGADIEILLPLGSVLIDQDSDTTVDILTSGQRVLLCRGGKGGRGSFTLRSPTNTTPKSVECGEKGEEKRFRIVYKIPVDIALIGLYQSGKSTLLNSLTHANAISPGYPFSTKIPTLGVHGKYRVVDLPSLIDGSSIGKGLGNGFLKHAERASILLICLAATSQNPVQDYGTIMKELEAYNNGLAQKKQIILLTLTDYFDKKTIEEKLFAFTPSVRKKILPFSSSDRKTIELLQNQIAKMSKTNP
jgi:GTPase